MWANQSRDAKFCVSQARMRNKQMRNMPAITALFARETQGWAINKCDYAPVITALFARETQGGAINKCYYMPVIAALFARETQNFASLLG